MQCSILKWLGDRDTELITFTKPKPRLWRYLLLRLKGKIYLLSVSSSFIQLPSSKLKKSAYILRYQLHLITSSIRPQMFQLGGCVIRTVTVVCCIAVCGTICWLSCTWPLDVVCSMLRTRRNDIVESRQNTPTDVNYSNQHHRYTSLTTLCISQTTRLVAFTSRPRRFSYNFMYRTKLENLESAATLTTKHNQWSDQHISPTEQVRRLPTLHGMMMIMASNALPRQKDV